MGSGDKPNAARPSYQMSPNKAGPLDDILGSLLGGGQPEQTTSKPKPKPKPSTSKPKPSTSQTTRPKPKPKPTQPAAEESGGMGDLLQTLLGGSQPTPTTSQTAKPKPKPKPKPTQPAAQESPDLGGLLQTFLGGGTQPQAASSQVTSGPLAPIVDMLAKKLNLPPAIAGIIVSFVLAKLLGGQGRSLSISPDLAQELAQQTGLDQETASRSLTTAMDLLRGQTGGRT